MAVHVYNVCMFVYVYVCILEHFCQMEILADHLSW